jgi:hypothetical protein
MKEINRFKARTKTGKEYTIIEYEPHTDPGTILLTSSGFQVKTLGFETYQIVETKDIVQRVWLCLPNE